MQKNYFFACSKLFVFFVILLSAQMAFASPQTYTYGSPDFNPIPTLSGATFTSSNKKVATIVNGLVHIVGVGTTNITGMAGTTTKTQVVDITAAALTITADNQSRAVNIANPTLTASYSGFVNGETAAVLTTPPTVTTTATTTSPIGSYPITASGAAAANYTITYVAGTLTVAAPTLTFSAIPAKVYGTADFNPGATSNAPITYTSSNTAAATIVNGNIHITGAGTATITATASTLNATEKLTVTKAPLTITANNQTKVAGNANPTLTVSYSGFVNGDSTASLTTQPKVTTTATVSSAAGTYPINVAGAVDADYTFTYVAGTLTVTAATLTFNALPAEVYGAADFSPGATSNTTIAYTSSNTAVATIVNGNIHITGFGTATITATAGSSKATQKLTVGKASLTVTANPQTKVYGSSLPALTLTYTGFANGDNMSVFTTAPTVSTTATASSTVGTYPITVTGAATTANYKVTYVNATLTISGASLTITANNQTKITGAANPALTITYTGFVNGDTQASLAVLPLISTTATTSSAPGIYPINVSSAVDNNYTITYVAGTLTVTSGPYAAPNVTYNISQTYTEGQPVNISPVNLGGPIPSQYNYSQTTTFAGSATGVAGKTNGTGTAARFNVPTSVAADGQGNIYVADFVNYEIRKITPAGVVSVLAGNGSYGLVNGKGTAASFGNMYAIAVDQAGNVYVSQPDVNNIRKITPQGVVTTFAGTGAQGSADGPGSSATFNQPEGLTVDAFGDICVADNGNGVIRKISATGIVSTLAGTPGTSGSIDGTGSSAYFLNPQGLAADNLGNIYVADQTALRKITSSGVVTTIISNNTIYLQNLNCVAVDAFGFIYVADLRSDGSIINRISPTGTITFAGNGVSGYSNGIGTQSSFSYIRGLAFSSSTTSLFVADANNNAIRQVSLTGYNVTPALPAGLSFSTTGVISGTSTAVYNNPSGGFAVSAYNQYGGEIVPLNLKIANSLTTSPNIYTVAGSGSFIYSGDGGPATAAGMNTVYGSALDKKGNLYLACMDNHIRKVDAVTKIITTIAGTGVAGYSGDGGDARNATFSFNLPALVVDTAGNIYLSDFNNNVIRKINGVTNVITTIAGNGSAGYSGDGASALQAQLSGPTGLVLDASNNLYFSDADNQRIRKINLTTGIITTVAGNGLGGFKGDGGQAKAAPIDFVERIALDKSNNLYISEEEVGIIRKVNLASGIISTFAGVPSTLQTSYLQGSAGDGGPATAAILGQTMGIAFDAAGNMYIADQTNGVIRKIDASTQIISTYAGIGFDYYSGDGGPAAAAGLNFTTDVLFDATGNMYIDDSGNNVIRRIGGSISAQTITFAPPAGSTGLNMADFNPGATASSGLPVTYTSSNTAVATIVNGLIHPVAVGTSTITASQAGNANFTAAANVAQVLTIKAKLAAPNLNYPVKTFTEGNPLSLNPTNTGGVVPANYYTQTITIAGTQGVVGASNAPASEATFSAPYGVVTDAAGNFYIADFSNHIIREITISNGLVTTFAGSGQYAWVDGTGTAASFTTPTGLAIDGSGNIYVTDNGSFTIRKITPAGVVTTLAGSGLSGNVNGKGTAASFGYMYGIAYTGGNLYVVDYGNHCIRKITAAGVVTTLAGSGNPVLVDGQGTAASFYDPTGIAADASGNLFVTDFETIREVTSGGLVSSFLTNKPGYVPFFNDLQNIAIDKTTGNMYLADDHYIRKVTPAGKVTTLAGNGGSSGDASMGSGAGLDYPFGIALNTFDGNLYISEPGDQIIRKVALTGYSVSPALPSGFSLSTTGVISAVPTNVLIDTAGYKVVGTNAAGTDTSNVKIQVLNSITTSPNIYTIAGTGTEGYSGDGGPAANAEINQPYAMTKDKAGNIYIATGDNYIRKIDVSTHNISTIAGTGAIGYTGDGGLAINATFNLYLPGIAVDSTGNVFISDNGNNAIREINAGTNIITTIAGNGTYGYSGDNGPDTSALLDGPGGIVIDANNNIYFSDESNGVIRRIDGTTHYITTYAGNGIFGVGTDNVAATASPIDFVERIAMDKKGGLYIDEEEIGAVRYVNSKGIITTVAGVPGYNNGQSSTGDGGLAIAARFGGIMDITLDAAGANLYIVDQTNAVIRKVNLASGLISTYAGIGFNAYSGDGKPAISATMDYPTDLFFDSKGNLFVDDLGNSVIRKIGGTSATDYNAEPVPNTLANSLLTNTGINAPLVSAALSPNGDGKNDVLTIANIEKYPVNKVILINSSGTKIFEATGYDNVTTVFNGHSNITSAIQQPGTYYYVLQYKDNGIIKSKSGYFVIKY